MKNDRSTKRTFIKDGPYSWVICSDARRLYRRRRWAQVFRIFRIKGLMRKNSPDGGKRVRA